jgi:hypothetical protein
MNSKQIKIVFKLNVDVEKKIRQYNEAQRIIYPNRIFSIGARQLKMGYYLVFGEQKLVDDFMEINKGVIVASGWWSDVDDEE